MTACLRTMLTLRNDGRAVTAVEYAVIAGALSVGILAAFTAFSTKISTFLGGISLS